MSDLILETPTGTAGPWGFCFEAKIRAIKHGRNPPPTRKGEPVNKITLFHYYAASLIAALGMVFLLQAEPEFLEVEVSIPVTGGGITIKTGQH